MCPIWNLAFEAGRFDNIHNKKKLVTFSLSVRCNNHLANNTQFQLTRKNDF